MPQKKAKIEPIHIEEAARLLRLFNARPAPKLSQAKFGEKYEIGSQGVVWQYLNARIPLNVEQAVRFAKGLNCSVSDFSPRLAAELAELHIPFSGTSRDVLANLGSSLPYQPGAVHDLPILTLGEIMDGKHHDLQSISADRARVKVASGEFSEKCFAVEVADDSMAGGRAPIMRGGYAIIDPGVNPENEDVVLLYEPGNKPVIRRFLLDGGRFFVQATGSALPPREVSAEHIVGVVTDVTYRIRHR